MELNSIEIVDREETARLSKIARDVVKDSHHLNADWLINNHLVVVPIESGMTDEDAERLSVACATFGYSRCFAIVTEPESVGPSCYEFATTSRGILEVSYECEPNHHVFLPEDRGFTILRPFGLYSLVAGSIKFVEIALGSTVSDARRAFFEYASDPAWSVADREMLLNVTKQSLFPA